MTTLEIIFYSTLFALALLAVLFLAYCLLILTYAIHALLTGKSITVAIKPILEEF